MSKLAQQQSGVTQIFALVQEPKSTEIIERLCLMTVDGGLSDDQALWGLGLKGTNFEQWLKDHPVKEGK